MTISLIVAAAEDHSIGKDGQLMWRIQNDMRFFKNTTWTFPVIMGRKTYEELGKALDGRSNFVVSRNAHWQLPDAEVLGSLDAAIAAAKKLQTHEIFVVGGAQIYRLALPLVQRMYITRVHAVFADADTHFPDDAIVWHEWSLVKQQRFEADEKNEYAHTIEVWERKDNKA
jgi:dihydrofolate reductase